MFIYCIYEKKRNKKLKTERTGAWVTNFKETVLLQITDNRGLFSPLDLVYEEFK